MEVHMTNCKAKVATVAIGNISVEGLLLPDGKFAISLQQLRELAFPSVYPSNAKKELKAACGKDFQFIRQATERANRPQWVVTIDQLNFCLTELAFRGHKEARDLVRLLAGLSLQQLFSDAFGIQFDTEERQKWLRSRQASKETFRPLTDALQKCGFTEPWEYGRFIHLFQQKLGIDDGTRDEQDVDVLLKLVIAQARITSYMDVGIEPYKALEMDWA
jgi:hypothetical protein